MMKTKVNPNMIELARKSRGLSQTALSKEIGCTQGAISQMELGVRPVSDEMLLSLVKTLRYPESFFFQTGGVYAPGIKYRRARASLSVRQRDTIDATNNIRARTITQLLKAVEIVNQNIPHMPVSDYGSPEEVAQALREYWRVPRGPIADLTRLVERVGFIIIHSDFGSKKLDGVYYPFPDLPPIIFLNKDFPGDRMRFTLAHEILHAVMHSVPIINSEEVEKETNVAAAEFMMPAGDIRDHLFNINLAKLASLKRIWKMSMASILVRAKSLETISPRQYQYLWKQMGSEGYRTREPVELDIPIEQPSIRDRLINIHLNELGYSEEELSRAIHINVDDFRREFSSPIPAARIYKLNNICN